MRVTDSQIYFSVRGFPPAKNEALSMLGAGHSHAPRVRTLLEAADAVVGEGFRPFEGRIGLEVVLSSPEGLDPWDATNYLGGIADVLEIKSRRGPLSHLGRLAQIGLYKNDRQIREVHYRQITGAPPSYTVRLWELNESAEAAEETAPGVARHDTTVQRPVE